MNTPPFLMGIALLFWGMQTGFLVFAAVMAVLLETSQFIKSRWEFSEKEYHRIFDLCGLLLLGAGGIASTSEDIRVPVLGLAQWLPFIFLPIIAAQAYGSRNKLTMRTLSWFLRRRKVGLAEKELNISYIYLGLCLLSAGAVSPGRSGEGIFGPFGTRTFYFAVATILIWALFSMRTRRVHGSVWVILIGCAAFFGYFGQIGLHELQKHLEATVTNWIGQFARREANLLESQTALGRIGQVKLSGRIVLRLEPQDGSSPPSLLRELSYDTYGNTVWRATRQEVGDLSIETNDVWRLHPDVPSKSSVRISGYLHKGQGLLALPSGTVELRDLAVGSVKTNVLGMTKVEDGAKFIRFLAKSTPTLSNDSPPIPEDREQIPEKEEAVLAQIAEELGLNVPGKTLDEKLRIIHAYFQNNFSYSTYITAKHVDPEKKKTALAMFLTETRSGHCEYFATAAVMLARQAGIPARYATGFAVQETSGKGGMYVVRERHAHAWTLVYREGDGELPGLWEDFDTTPASWDEIEAQKASFWQPVSDLWARMTYEFSKWRYSKTNFRQYAIWLLVPLVIFLVWRIFFSRKRKRIGAGSVANAENVWPGLDSELYEMEEELAGRGLERMQSEPLTEWKERVQATECVPAEAFKTAVELHVRYRFDPHGLDATERELLRENVRNCLRRLSRKDAVGITDGHIAAKPQIK
ncbi:MAG: transglutaminase domain-containing protein [Verrucomicrobia bacterium]|nr:transglutaminase domain-containing protein [Verrucomicrobiota bacterium]